MQLRNFIKKLIWFSGFKLGLLITLVFCLLKYFGGAGSLLSKSATFELLENVENTITDLKFKIRGGVNTEEEKRAFQEQAHVVIVAVDERSNRMPDLGLWPWPRAKIATLIDNLEKCGASVIAFDVVFAEPDTLRVLPALESLQKEYEKAQNRDEGFSQVLAKNIDDANGDKKMADVLSREEYNNVVLGYFFFLDPAEMRGDLGDSSKNLGYGTIGFTYGYPGTNPALSLPRAIGVRANLPMLTEAAEYFGFFNMIPDSDRIYRHAPLVFAFNQEYFPSLSLQALALYYHQLVNLFVNTLDRESYDENLIKIFLGPLGKRHEAQIEVPVERGGLFRVNYYGQHNTFLHISAGDIIHGETNSCAAVKGKIALVGATTIGIYDLRPTPFESSFPGVEIHASVIENVITGQYLMRPFWMANAEILFMLVIGVLLSWVLNRFRLTIGLILALFGFLALPTLDYLFMFRNGILTHVVMPSIQSLVMFVGIAVYRYATEEREKSKIRHAFQFYLTKSVIDTMLQDTTKLKLGGERRELTVLFSDIRGFTTISERLAPEALTELLNEYLTPMTDLVFKYNGTLDKYMGDAIMAIYGAPLAYPQHAKDACETALDMMEELARLRAGWKQRGLPELDIGIGVNTGPMSVGNMGSKTRFDYTVIGDNVNLGSRLEGLNKQYGSHIIISQFTHDHVKNDFVCRELDAVIVKGKLEPVRIFELQHRAPQDPARDSWLEEFHNALVDYKSRKFDEALEVFSRLSQARPNDGVCRMYAERCAQMKANPPPPDWDGVFKMTTK